MAMLYYQVNNTRKESRATRNTQEVTSPFLPSIQDSVPRSPKLLGRGDLSLSAFLVMEPANRLGMSMYTCSILCWCMYSVWMNVCNQPKKDFFWSLGPSPCNIFQRYRTQNTRSLIISRTIQNLHSITQKKLCTHVFVKGVDNKKKKKQKGGWMWYTDQEWKIITQVKNHKNKKEKRGSK